MEKGRPFQETMSEMFRVWVVAWDLSFLGVTAVMTLVCSDIKWEYFKGDASLEESHGLWIRSVWGWGTHCGSFNPDLQTPGMRRKLSVLRASKARGLKQNAWAGAQHLFLSLILSNPISKILFSNL